MIKDEKANPEPPKNKILIVLPSDSDLDHKAIVFKLFGIKVGEDDRIVKNLVWKTKYYEVCFDLYIDEYVKWQLWFREFSSEEFSDLRNVLAGLVVVNQYSPDFHPISCGLEEAFVVWINTDSKVSQDALDEVNDQLLAQYQETTVEVLNLHAKETTNNYGEKISCERFRELIDTCRWKNCQMKLQANQDSATSSDVPLELVIHKMQQARIRHQNLDLDEQEAMQIAEEVANELTRGEQNSL